MNKERVLIVHNYYQVPGGEDTVVENEKKMLEDNGHEVTLYCRNNCELKEVSKIQKLYLLLTMVFSFRTYREVKKIIREKKIDIVHVHNTLCLISPSVYYAAFSCKIPVVQTIHNFRLLCPGATFYRDGHICEDCVNKGLKCALIHKCYRGSKVQTLASTLTLKIHRLMGTYKKINYICLTEFTKERLSILVGKKNIYVKPNFTFDEGGSSSPQDYYMFIGRLEEIKGIDLLVDAFKQIPDYKLIIIGTGVLDGKIKARLKNEKIKNVELLGYKKRGEINILLIHAKALIMCSQCYETFGMVIAEAYSNGIPAIAGDIGNIKDIVIEGETGVKFKYNSSGDLKDAILRFEQLDGNILRENAYQLFKNRYSAEENYQILSRIYKQLMLVS